MQHSILLIDRDPMVLERLPALFSTTEDLKIIKALSSAHQAIQWLGRNSCDVILSESQLCDMPGTELLRRVPLLKPPSPTFVVLDHNYSNQSLIAFLSLDAKGYALKKSRLSELSALVRTAIAGDIALSPSCASDLIDFLIKNASIRHLAQDFSAEEALIIECIRQGMTNQEIALKMNYAEITIKKKISRIFARHGIKNRSQLATVLLPFVDPASHPRTPKAPDLN